MKKTDTHIFFLKEWLSNFKSCTIVSNNNTFSNTEQMFMYHKALFFEDFEIADEILKTPIPYEAKALGRLVKGYSDDDWSKVRYDVMFQVNLCKYTQNPELKEKLLATDNKILVEVNPRDNIWGIGMDEDNPDIYDETKWRGLNLLGKVLMEVRDELKP
jgi:ribA/ribD-fused uncharacterized protein